MRRCWNGRTSLLQSIRTPSSDGWRSGAAGISSTGLDLLNPPRHGEGDRRSRWRCLLNISPSTTLRVVPLPRWGGFGTSLRRQLAQDVVQDAAVVEVLQLVDGIDPAKRFE